MRLLYYCAFYVLFVCACLFFFFFFNDTATTEIYTLSLHDALPIRTGGSSGSTIRRSMEPRRTSTRCSRRGFRSEEHTSELQSQFHLVCRLLLEKKKKNQKTMYDERIQ